MLSLREEREVKEILAKAIKDITHALCGDPLDGDEVGVVSVLFVEGLCKHNGEEDQVDSILKVANLREGV